MAQQADGVLERPVTARVEDLAADGVLLSIGFWTDSRRSDFKDATSEVRLVVIDTLRAAGVPLPEPDLWRVETVDPGGWTDALAREAPADRGSEAREGRRPRRDPG